MAGCGRRFAVRASIACFAAAIGLGTTAAASEAAAKPIQITVQVGYHNTVKLGQWMPVVVDLTNTGPAVDGTLEVQASNTMPGNGGPPIGAAVYHMPLSLATGATKHVRTYVTEDFPGSIDVRVVESGRLVASQEASVSNTYSGLMAAVISDQAGSLDGLGIIRSGLQPLVVHLAPAEISDSAPVLRAFDLIAIDDFATDSLTEGQRTALADYVVQGGALLLGTGGSWHKTLAGLPSAMVPMKVTGSKVLGSAGALSGVGRLEVATGTLTPGSSAWLAESDQPLLVEAPVGAGLVEMATFDWNQDSISSWNGISALLRNVFVRSTYGNTNNMTVSGPIAGKFGGVNSLATKGGSLTQALANVPALNLPAWWLIGSLVLLYVLLAGPVNYLVLRALNRRALAWITVPAIAIVGSAGAYGAGVITKGTSVLANEISIVHVEQGWDRAYQEQYTGVLAPTRGDYEVALGSGHTMITPIYYYSGPVADPNFGAMRVNTTTHAVTLPGMTAFTLRGFANERTVAAPQLTSKTQFADGKLSGTIRNLSPLNFTDGVVFSANSFQKLGALGPDGSLAFSVQLPTGGATGTFPGQPIFMNVYPNAYTGGFPNSSSDLEREYETRTSILSTLMMNSVTGMTGPTAPTVVLWTKQPLQDVTINGGHPRTYAESAVVMTLSTGLIASGSLPRSVVQGRVVDIDADVSQGGQQGLMVAQGGSISFSFLPALAPGRHLTRVTIDSVNPFGPKGIIGPNGAVVVPRAQVWDWSRSAWVDIDYQDNASSPVPDAAIQPSTGEVRLKLSSDGQFSSSSLSITGKVQ